MNTRPPEHDSKLIEDADVHYGAETKSQGPLPFSIWVRRKYRWWPGSERYGCLVDRLLMAMIIVPGVVWALTSFGWIPALFIVAEAIIVAEIVYRVATGTMLGD